MRKTTLLVGDRLFTLKPLLLRCPHCGKDYYAPWNKPIMKATCPLCGKEWGTA